MKKLLILLFSILISFNSYGGLFDKTVCFETETLERGGLFYLPNKTKPFSGKNLCEYPSGQYKSKGNFKNGMMDGQWTLWNENGQITGEHLIKNNEEITTKIIYYDENGYKEKEIWLENGQEIHVNEYSDGKCVYCPPDPPSW